MKVLIFVIVAIVMLILFMPFPEIAGGSVEVAGVLSGGGLR